MSEPRLVPKPWGHEEIWAEGPGYVGKVLYIRDGHRLSLQHHAVKHEHMRVHRGVLHLELEDEVGELQHLRLEPGQSVVVPPGRRHRLRAEGDVEVFEVSTPQLDDVVRHSDDYGRV